jgi:uncharacterized Tic20 family protein
MTTQAQNNPFVSAHTSDERTMAALAHGSAVLNLFAGIGGLIAAFVIWMTQKEKSAWVAFHALQSLVFQAVVLGATVLVVVLVWIVGFAVSFATVGIGTIVAVPVMILSFFVGFIVIGGVVVYGVYGAYQIYQGREFRYIWIGNWLQQRAAAH